MDDNMVASVPLHEAQASSMGSGGRHWTALPSSISINRSICLDLFCFVTFQQLLQLTALVHFGNNVRASDKLSINIELRDGRPV